AVGLKGFADGQAALVVQVAVDDAAGAAVVVRGDAFGQAAGAPGQEGLQGLTWLSALGNWNQVLLQTSQKVFPIKVKSISRNATWNRVVLSLNGIKFDLYRSDPIAAQILHEGGRNRKPCFRAN